MKVDIINQKNEKVGTIDLSDKIFGVKWNADLVHQAFVAQISNSREPIAHAKDRSEVRGGGRKPWKQKGTGRARHGSTRSPLWIGGGAAFGPRKEKNFTKKINKKMKRLAIMSVLSRKLKEKELKVIDSLNIEAPKTNNLSKILKIIVKPMNVLLIPSLTNKNIYRASANIPKVKSLSPISLNVSDLLKYKNIILDKEAISEIESYYKI